MALILPIFRECKKEKLHILKKVGLSTFKEILKKYVYNSTVAFFNILLFCLKGYSETLKVNNILKVLCATNSFNFICNDKIGRKMVWKDGLHLTNDGTADNLAVNFMLADNFTKHLNINLSTDFKVNSNFNNDFLD